MSNYLGPDCKACPVREFGHCDTITYRGSRCAELRDEIGLDDPETVTPVNYAFCPNCGKPAESLRTIWRDA